MNREDPDADAQVWAADVPLQPGAVRGRTDHEAVPHNTYRAFIDESSALRSRALQEYLVAAALIPISACDDVREHLRSLALPGQIKLHWTSEGEPRRRDIVNRIAELGPMTMVVTHLSERVKKNERFRRKCLETLYHNLVTMEVFDLVLEDRSPSQNRKDLGHLVALRTQGLDKRLRIHHQRGGDEPLLWIADILLGAINSAKHGQPAHLEALKATILLQAQTVDSLEP